MGQKSLLAAALLVLTPALSACDDEPQLSNLSYEEVRRAAAEDPAEFKAFFDGVKGQAVAWSGHVVEAREQYEDDYMKSAVLLVDMDGGGQSPAVPDVEFKIAVSEAARYQAGQEVRFTGILREFDNRRGLLLKLEPREVE